MAKNTLDRGLVFRVALPLLYALRLWDLFQADPGFSSPVTATVRVALQIMLIYIGYILWSRSRKLTVHP